MRKITLIMKDNKPEQVDVVRYFELNQSKYLIYTLGEIDQNAYQTLYVVREMKELGKPILQTIRDEEDWNNLKQQIREIIKQLKKGTPQTFADLNSASLDGLYVADARVFKLAQPIVEILMNHEEPEASEMVLTTNVPFEPTSAEEEVIPPPPVEKMPVVTPRVVEEAAPIDSLHEDKEPIGEVKTDFPVLEETELPEAKSNQTETITPLEPIVDPVLPSSEKEELSSVELPSESVSPTPEIETMPSIEDFPKMEEMIPPVMEEPVIADVAEEEPLVEEVIKKGPKKKFKPSEEVKAKEETFKAAILDLPPVPENVPIVSLEEVYATLQREMEQLKETIEKANQDKANLEAELATQKDDNAMQAKQIEELNAQVADFEAKFENIKGIIE